MKFLFNRISCICEPPGDISRLVFFRKKRSPNVLLVFYCLYSALLSLCSSYANAALNLDDIERYTVVATPSLVDETLSSITPQYYYDASNIALPQHINDVLMQSPSVSLNGQGGQIQNINIRGFSRWRIQTLLDGVPIISDRRAGSSVGFVPPLLIKRANVITGGTSTYLGSGAIGGAVNLMFADEYEPSVRITADTNQSLQGYQYQDVAENLGWLVSHRKADNGTDTNGELLFDQFTQTALFARYKSPPSNTMSQTNSPLTSAWTLYSHNSDIGKSSSNFPNRRTTIYPSNNHWLGKMRFAFGTTETNIDADVWWHVSSLDTNTVRPQKRINESTSSAFDFGGSIRGDTLGNISQSWLKNWRTHWEVQLRGRDNVAIDEAEFDITNIDMQTALLQEPVFERKTLNATEYNVAGLVDAARTFDSTTLALGARLDWLYQQRNSADIDSSALNENRNSDVVTATNPSGFAGINHAFSDHVSVNLYISTAFRNPSLTERFFSGETPRGAVFGNRDLNAERATSIQSGLYVNYESAQMSVELFSQHIRDYIERQSLDDTTLTYRNLDSASIRGVTYEAQWQPHNTEWRFNASGAWIKGEDKNGNNIADIPPRRVDLSVQYSFSNVTVFGTARYRASKHDIGEGERLLSDVYTFDIGTHWLLSSNVELKLSIRNATNQQFYVSADDQAAFAQGRSVQGALTLLL